MNKLQLLFPHLLFNEYSNWLFLNTYNEKLAPKMNKKITKTIKSDIKTTTLFEKEISYTTYLTILCE